MGSSIVFVDWRVADIDSILAGIPADAEVIILDGASDGLDQIAARLQGRSGLDAIHIISHGSSGSVSLGSGVIDSAALAEHAIQLDTIGQALTESGDILLYGCNVAQGDAGVQFIGSLAQTTGADVAASTDLTGAAALGGNWTLEVATGSIEEAELSADIEVILPIGPLAHPSPSNQLGPQTQTMANPTHSVAVGMLFATLLYGDRDLLANTTVLTPVPITAR